jgi:uncharacterized membrane protein YdjX (TVP38/TMEM64 family)
MTILWTLPRKPNLSGEITAEDLPEFAGVSLRDKVLGIVILLALTALFFWLTVDICRPFFLLAYSPERFNRFIKEQGAMGRITFFGFQVMQGFLPIPMELTAVAGGYAFGRLQGTVLTLCAVMTSTTIIFQITKMFGHRLIDLFFTREQQHGARRYFSRRVGNTLTWLLFLIPGTPKRIFVFTAGLVPQNFRRFLLVSTLARVPSLLACTFCGYALENGNYKQAILLLLAVTAASAAGIVLYMIFNGKRSEKRA